MLPLKLSHNEKCGVIVYLWEKIFNANHILSEMPPEYGDKCFAKPTAHV